MDTNIDMGTSRSVYALCLRSKKRCSSQLVDPSFPMTITPLPSLMSSSTDVISQNHVVISPVNTSAIPINIPDDINQSGGIIEGTSFFIPLLWFHHLFI